MTTNEWTGFYSHFEGLTATGQHVQFTAKSEDGEMIREAIGRAKSFPYPLTKHVGQGGKASFSRYKITQHGYAGGNDEGGGGYIELLEIHDAPDGRCRFVTYSYSYYLGGTDRNFSEWDSLEDARAAFTSRKCFSEGTRKICKGLKRYVDCGELTPWFYAIGDEILLGDFAVISGFEAHPVYRLGRRFLIQTKEGQSKVVTCMGSSRYSYMSERSCGADDKTFYWAIMFSDGSHIHIGSDDRVGYDGVFEGEEKTIMPLPEGKIWQMDVLAQFMKILSGHSLGGLIKLADGGTISLKYQPQGKKPPSAKGRYFLRVTLAEGGTMEGSVDFDPKVDLCEGPVEKMMGRTPKGATSPVVKVQILNSETEDGKKWRGVWYDKLEGICVAK